MLTVSIERIATDNSIEDNSKFETHLAGAGCTEETSKMLMRGDHEMGVNTVPLGVPTLAQRLKEAQVQYETALVTFAAGLQVQYEAVPVTYAAAPQVQSATKSVQCAAVPQVQYEAAPMTCAAAPPVNYAVPPTITNPAAPQGSMVQGCSVAVEPMAQYAAAPP